MHGQEQDVGLKRQHCNRQASDLPSRFTMATCLSLTVCFRHCNPAGDGVAGNVSFCRLVSVGKMLRTTTLLPLRSSSVREIGSCGNLTKLECPKYRVCKLVNERYVGWLRQAWARKALTGIWASLPFGRCLNRRCLKSSG